MIRSFFRRTGRAGLVDQRGAVAIEFAIIAPILLVLIFSILEAGWIMTQSIMLDRGVRLVTRTLQVGTGSAMTYQDLKQNICEAAMVLGDCSKSLRIEFTTIDGPGDFPEDAASCIDRSVKIDPVTTYNAGAREQIVYARACLVIDPLVPGLGFGMSLLKDETGGFRVVSRFAFINEPG